MEFEYISKEGLEELKKKLDFLKNEERPKIIQAIQEAREHGDLKENAEYKDARERQRIIDKQIAELEAKLRSVRVIDETNISTDKVGLLSKVTIKNLKLGKEVTYTIVSSAEADFKKGKISTSAPIGRALLGRKVGDIVEVKVPAGIMKFEILKISK